MWSNSGFENDTLTGLVLQTASWHVENSHEYKDYSCLMLHTPLGDAEASLQELLDHNEAVRVKIDELKNNAYLSRSDNQKYNEYMSDCADNNWKERD
jgi:hypothetical protein